MDFSSLSTNLNEYQISRDSEDNFYIKKKVQKGKIEYFIRKKIKLAYVTNIVDMNRRKIRVSVMENMKIV